MNMKQLEQLLRDIRKYEPGFGEWNDKLDNAIKFVQQRQRSAQRRKAHFRFLADEQRELLR